jgi:hypothetical protein
MRVPPGVGGLPLTLFMLGILADDPYYTVAADDLAVVTHFLY